VDMWGIGCVFGEMLTGRPVLQGLSDQDQVDKIFQLCGSPTEENMPGWSSLPGLEEKGVVYQINKHYQRKLKEDFEPYGTLAADLMDKLLVLDPKKRLTAFAASDHDYLWVEPLPAEIGMLPVYESSHEYDHQKKQQERHASHHHNSNNPSQNTHHHHGGHGHHLPPRGGNGGGSGTHFRSGGAGGGGGGGYGGEHDRPRDKPRSHVPAGGGAGGGGGGAAGSSTGATTYRPIPLPPKPATAVPPAMPSSAAAPGGSAANRRP